LPVNSRPVAGKHSGDKLPGADRITVKTHFLRPLRLRPLRLCVKQGFPPTHELALSSIFKNISLLNQAFTANAAFYPHPYLLNRSCREKKSRTRTQRKTQPCQ
jgi:hypothetical protein